MKQSVVAVLLVVGLLAPHASQAQAIQCTLLCNPPRMICYPAGSVPPINKICPRTASAEIPAEQPALTSPSQSTAARSACSPVSVFNEDTQSFEWEMQCD